MSSRSWKGFFLAVVLILASCQRESSPGPPAVLTVGIEGNPTGLDPRIAQDSYSLRILPLVYEGLFELGPDTEPRPLLVESWERTGEREYIFRLHRGHRFPDGTELTAGDVVYTLDSLADPSLLSARKQLREKIATLQAPDDFIVILTLAEPYAPLLTDLCLGIVPAAAGKDPGEYGRRPFGSGPYRVQSFDPGAQVVLTPNPNYHGPQPALPRIVFKVIPDDVTRVLSLERGEVQLLLNSVPPDDVSRLQKNPRLDLVMQPGINYYYLGFNLTDPILADLRVRQAIAHAIDRQKIGECLLQGTVTPATGILAPFHWAYNPDVRVYEHDLDLAKRLLDEAGWKDPDGDGPQPRFRLEYKTSQNKARRWVAEAIADELAAAGIEVEVRALEWGTFFADIKAGNFQVYSLSWVGITDPDIYYFALHSQSQPPSGANRNRYRSERMDRLAERGRTSLDRSERQRIYREAQAVAAEELPYVSLFYTNDVVARDRRLKGFVVYPGGDYRSLARATWQP